MTFTTLTFVVFLAVVFGAYWTIRERKTQNLVLLVASYAFYAWWDWRFCGLMLASSLVDFAIGIGLHRVARPVGRKALLTVSVVFNLGLLGFFKYFDFFVANLVALTAALGFELRGPGIQILLPVGISFYTFQTMSYTIDIYRRELRPTADLIDYLAYVSFFPQLVAGPIERAQAMLPQFATHRRFDAAQASDGCRQILWGFFKKMAIADRMALFFVDPIYSDAANQGGPALALATVAFAIQIYCDFSAYSDIAVGSARLLGFSLMRNFAYPYFSQSLGEFWRRWHISLSTWFRDYVYIPLGGSRRGRARMVFNALTTFVVSGLWHGAAWNYVVWGAVNGLGVLPSMVTADRKRLGHSDVPGGPGRLPSPGALIRMLATFALTCLAWVFFRARDLGEAISIIGKILRESFAAGPVAAGWQWLARYSPLPLAICLALWLTFEWCNRRERHPLKLDTWPWPVRWAAYSFLLWASLLLGPHQQVQFVYFQF